MWSSPAGSADRFKVDAGAPSLEKKIGQYWLNRVGILAVLAGVAYFLKLAFDNHWIGESIRPFGDPPESGWFYDMTDQVGLVAIAVPGVPI